MAIGLINPSPKMKYGSSAPVGDAPAGGKEKTQIHDPIDAKNHDSAESGTSTQVVTRRSPMRMTRAAAKQAMQTAANSKRKVAVQINRQGPKTRSSKTKIAGSAHEQSTAPNKSVSKPRSPAKKSKKRARKDKKGTQGASAEKQSAEAECMLRRLNEQPAAADQATPSAPCSHGQPLATPDVMAGANLPVMGEAFTPGTPPPPPPAAPVSSASTPNTTLVLWVTECGPGAHPAQRTAAILMYILQHHRDMQQFPETAARSVAMLSEQAMGAFAQQLDAGLIPAFWVEAEVVNAVQADYFSSLQLLMPLAAATAASVPM